LEIDLAIHPGDRRVIRNILRHNNQWIVALNKIDKIKKPQLLPILQAYANAPQVGAIVPISAWHADGLRPLLEAVRTYLPEAEPEFAADELTDRSLRFLCAELIREQVFLQTRDEVPYGVACEIEVFEELPDLTHVQALVHVEKQAQRGILIGKGGARMKALGMSARQQMERLLGRKVFLEIHVRVEADWAQRLDKLKDFGYIE
jgi:GTP-binding protein Era